MQSRSPKAHHCHVHNCSPDDCGQEVILLDTRRDTRDISFYLAMYFVSHATRVPCKLFIGIKILLGRV